ncbi:MAG TPA: DNA polymerase III subunit delta' [Thermodesulfovibrionales bacterium]|nr:DNA polymerase III subunit delta' [Thermodesulfovibrionales bacterium]
MALKDVIGQGRAVGILLRTLRRRRTPSAYLFAGESGIGKRFTAVNLAKAINCLKDRDEMADPAGGSERVPLTDMRQEEQEDSCDSCVSCLKIDSGTHPDVIMISPDKGEIRVSEIREVEDALSLMPHEGRKKVVIIDEADTMNQSAANAFLKTLEEPPEDSLIILIASNPDRLPETIRSRCSRLLFTPLSGAACGEVIRLVDRREAASRCATDKRAVTRTSGADSDLPARIRLSMGRPGLALSSDLLKEQERFVGILRSVTGGQHETWADRDEMERWLDMAVIFLRDVAVLQLTHDEGMLFSPDIRGLSEAGARADIRALVESFDALTRLKRKLDFNLNKGITWNYTASVLRNIVS